LDKSINQKMHVKSELKQKHFLEEKLILMNIMLKMKQLFQLLHMEKFLYQDRQIVIELVQLFFFWSYLFI